MRHTLTKVRNGLWIVEWEDGQKSRHSMQSGAEKAVLEREHRLTLSQ